ncbi:hypothetical protein AB0L35_32980 [Streptomyces sp. NPDC052309]|uniref:hypothetical protein n=1 Tax=Streptomyces sp. NPDC052309 TaxID=3155421 RepID=UPI0034298959
MSRTTAVTALVATAVLAGGAIAVPAQAQPHTAPRPAVLTQAAPAEKASPVAAKSTRQQTLQRARTWLTANGGRQVPYSQSKTWKDGYRQDCSGYVSMALRLAKPGPNTVALAKTRSLTRPIAMNQLKPGDLVIDAIGDGNSRHVVIFEKWNNAAHTSYTAYEQRGRHGTDHRSLTYGLKSGSQYKAYRPVQYGD